MKTGMPTVTPPASAVCSSSEYIDTVWLRCSTNSRSAVSSSTISRKASVYGFLSHEIDAFANCNGLPVWLTRSYSSGLSASNWIVLRYLMNPLACQWPSVAYAVITEPVALTAMAET